VLVDEVLDRGKRARPLVGADPQPRKCVGGNLGVPGAHLAPPYRAVAVAIQADRVFEVAQRDVPLAFDLGSVGANREIAVARLVRVCG